MPEMASKVNKIDNVPTGMSKISLREINSDTVRPICRLTVSDHQNKFVAPNSISIAQAHFSKHAWFRAIYADDTPVGFAMLHDEPEKPEYFLWRFMIDAQYQGLGFGRQAIELLIEHVKMRPNATVFLLSVVQEDGGPQQFYEKLGFELTGGFDDGEAIMRLQLTSPNG